MKLNLKRMTAVLSSVAGSLLLMQNAQAQFSYTSRDMLLVFRQTSGVQQDLEINIGQASTYYGATPGSTINITQVDTSQLTSLFGNLDNVSWSICATVPAAGDSGDPSKPVKTIWATAPRSDITQSAAPWTRFSATSQGGTSGKIKSALDNAVFYGTQVPAGNTNTSSLIVIPAGSGHDAGSFLGSFGNWGNTFQGDVENTTPADFDSAGQPSRSDLYELIPSSTGGNGKLLGYFQLNTDGTMAFTALSAPVITSGPSDSTMTNGSTVVLTAAVTGDGLSYQWSKNASPLSDNGTAISGSQTASLTLANVANANSGTYSLTVVNDAGSASTNAALFVVDGPAITTQPQDQPNQTNGANVTLSVVATGQLLGYQWLLAGSPISGATDSSYSFTATPTPGPTDTNLSYSVVVSNITGTVTSSTATVGIILAPTIITQPQSASKQPQGTSETLSVVATGGGDLQYQWYQGATSIAGATGSTYTFKAQPAPAPTDTNVNYSVVVSNISGTVTSSNATISIVIDKIAPTLVLSLPHPNARAGAFDIQGVAKDNTNVAFVKYTYSNTLTHVFSAAPFVLTNTGTPKEFDFHVVGDTNGTAGTNVLSVWSEDLAGKQSAVQKRTIFVQQASPFVLTILGDGTGTVNGKTKGAAGETVPSSTATTTLNLYLGQTYQLFYKPTAIVGVVSNAPGMAIGVSQKNQFAGTPFIMGVGSNATVYFNRNRLVDMAGKYAGVFSVSGDPEIASSGMLNPLSVTKAGTFSGKIYNNGNTPAIITGKVSVDGNIAVTNGNLILTAKLLWDGSENPGPCQISGTVSNTVDNWNATLLADRAETNAPLTPGTKEVMSIPGTNAPTGSSFATISSSKSARTFAFTLADGGRGSLANIGYSASGNIPIFINPRYMDGSKSALFGTWNTASNQVTLNWVKAASGTVNPTGFSIAPLATIETFTAPGLTGTHTVTIHGGGLTSDLTFLNVTAGVKSVQAGVGAILMTVSPLGTATVHFGTGTRYTLTGSAGIMTVSNNAAGFFLPSGAADSGSITITP